MGKYSIETNVDYVYIATVVAVLNVFSNYSLHRHDLGITMMIEHKLNHIKAD